PSAKTAKVWADFLDEVRKSGSSTGAVIEVVADGVPVGLGAPLYAKLDGDIAANLMSINAVKGVEIGDGFAAATLSGEENADEIRIGPDGAPQFLTNHAGGILGGISTGQPVVARFAVKPTSSILTPTRSVDADGQEVDVMTKGRHDPCVGIRAVPIGEGMAAAALTGRDNADEIFMGPDGPEYGSNHAGGVLGGISSGQDVVLRFAVKPTSSILSPRRSIKLDGSATEVITKGRHDPCVGIRAVPVAEAMMACVLLDHYLLDRGQTGGVRGTIG
ncbi:MAG: chorismate synthase, partial [Limimaricola sp.]